MELGDECDTCKKIIVKENSYTTKCNHKFCYDCSSKWLSSKYTCPLCDKKLITPRIINSCTSCTYTNNTTEPMTWYRFILWLIGVNREFTFDTKKMMSMALIDFEPYSTLTSLYYTLTIRHQILDDDEFKRGIDMFKKIMKLFSFSALIGLFLFYQTSSRVGLIWSKLVFFVKLFDLFMTHIDSESIKTYFYKKVNNSNWFILFTVLSATNLYWLILPSFLLSSNSDINLLSKYCIWISIVEFILTALVLLGSLFKLIDDFVRKYIEFLRRELYAKNNIIDAFKLPNDSSYESFNSILKPYGIRLPTNNKTKSRSIKGFYRGDWSDVEIYLTNDVVNVANVNYVSLCDGNINNPTSDVTKWITEESFKIMKSNELLSGFQGLNDIILKIGHEMTDVNLCDSSIENFVEIKQSGTPTS